MLAEVPQRWEWGEIIQITEESVKIEEESGRITKSFRLAFFLVSNRETDQIKVWKGE